MTKYQQYWQERKPRPQKHQVHPIWAGIGIILMILTPILAYASTLVLLMENAKRRWFAIPPDMIAPGADPYLYVKIILTVFFIIVFSAIFMLITFALYSLFGPSRYGPLDVEPTAYRGPRYRR